MIEELPPPNFVKIGRNECKVLTFDDLWFEKRKIRDPKTHRVKEVTVMVLHVIKENGREVDKQFGVISYKLMQTLYNLYKRNWLFARPIKICRHGEDYATEYTVELYG